MNGGHSDMKSIFRILLWNSPIRDQRFSQSLAGLINLQLSETINRLKPSSRRRLVSSANLQQHKL